MWPATAFRYSPSIVVILDAADGRIVDVNAAFTRLLGIDREEAIGNRSIDLGLWTQLEARALIWVRLRSSRRVCGELIVMRSRLGHDVHGRLHAEIFEHEGRDFVLSIVQDVGHGGGNRDDVARQVTIDNYRSLFDAAIEGIYRRLPDGGFIDANTALARMFGYESPVDMLAAPIVRANELYVDSLHARKLIEELERDGRLVNAVSQVFRRDGSVIWISENVRAIRASVGQTAFYEGTVVDITERVLADMRLRQSQALYKTLVDNCRDGVFLVQAGSMLFANRALADMLGYQLDQLPRDYMDLIAPSSRDAQLARAAERDAGSRATCEAEVMMLHADGSPRLMQVTSVAVDYEGRIASTGTIHDITDSRRRHDAIAAAEQKYRALFRNSVTGMFQSHPDGSLIEANDAIARMLGYADAADILARIHHMHQLYARPADRDEMIARLLRDERVVSYVFPARHVGGSEVLVDLNAQLVRDDAGNVQYVEGSVQDITARRQAEDALQRSEMRYRTLIEHSQIGVYMMLDDHYTYVNHAFAVMFGYAEKDLVGADFRILVPPESIDHQERRYQRQTAGKGKAGDYAVTLMRKDRVRIEVIVSAGRIDMDGKKYTTGTIRDVTDQLRAQGQLEHNATHDLLTGLPNRVHFERRLEQVIAAARTAGSSDYAVLFLDLDGFKVVNDSLGHACGDVLLVQIAATLRSQLGDDVLVARYGGDEFTLLPPQPCLPARAEEIAQRVLTLLSASFNVNGHRVFSGASVGVVLGRQEYVAADAVLRDADTAMYRAKARGKSAYVIFDDAMHAAARERLKIETELRLALERGEFRVYYQPVVDLHSGVVRGCESLVRWEHPQRGLLLPADFLGVAEEAGLVVALDWWVMEQTCRNLRRWQKLFPQHDGLIASVNMNERQFSDHALIPRLLRVIEGFGLDPSRLALEITETIFRGGREEAQARLRELKGLGVSLVVDDFGTGYSSLDSFATSAFDALKVDRSFVRDLSTNFRHEAIVRTVTGFAENLGLRLIAEGVETVDQANLLRRLGCSLAQGDLYAPAMPAEAMEKLLETGLQNWRKLESGAVA